ncbi:outer membrane transport energization protein TonB [Litorimonas taeanensis]|uniref:Outer membrane transport energization protein TonB n=1 Tax=Litorimonas taeanensis TaxID=568099 RepID=A0A420WIM5_9PROT|nr:energy transducer TonB [Litorimonas taeanensis]RKQ70881.1 outer membrane transport energization protein TonB [Litorimonas taeanensis]
MSTAIRWLIGIPVAAFVTVALFVLMTVLISAEFEPQDKVKTASFEINPKVEDIKVIERETKVDKVQKVVTPPPPPMIERAKADKPTEAIASLEGAIPDFETPKIDRQSFKIAVSDRDAQPLVRIPPIMPTRAEKSGHCTVRFDVSPEGAPFNVVATYCTQSLFERASVKSVQKWKYNPKIVDGRSVARSGVESKISFRLSDERGRIIPE